MKRPLQTFFLFGFSTLLALALAEGVTRQVHPQPTVEYRVDPEVGQILVANQRARWVHEDYDVEITTNSGGFHDVEHRIEKPMDTYRIVVLGDSFVEGLAVPIESGFTQQLESLLQPEVKNARLEVLNLAVSGVGPAQYLRMLERRGISYKPDLVLMAVYPENDFWDSYYGLSGGPSKAFYAIGSNESLQYIPPEAAKITVKIRPFLRRSAFLTLLREGITLTSLESQLGRLGVLQAPGVVGNHKDWGIYDAALPDPWPEAYRTTLRIIDASRNLASRHGAEFLVMTIGSVAMVEDRWSELYSSYPAAKAMILDVHRPFTAIADLGREQGFAVIDLADPFRQDFLRSKTSRSWPHDGHWNNNGHRLAAEIVARYLLAHRYEYRLPN
ncbi:MAG TPA: SGNH/GDSL hydrolase family protein [Nitrospira sp.]|nr:SGNH/GDSL hydrolase family protein [Nitrospira sp.]